MCCSRRRPATWTRSDGRTHAGDNSEIGHREQSWEATQHQKFLSPPSRSSATQPSREA